MVAHQVVTQYKCISFNIPWPLQCRYGLQGRKGISPHTPASSQRSECSASRKASKLLTAYNNQCKYMLQLEGVLMPIIDIL